MTAYLVIEIPEGEKYQVDSSFADMLDHSVDGFFVYNRDAHCAIGDITTQISSFLSRFANPHTHAHTDTHAYTHTDTHTHTRARARARVALMEYKRRQKAGIMRRG